MRLASVRIFAEISLHLCADPQYIRVANHGQGEQQTLLCTGRCLVETSCEMDFHSKSRTERSCGCLKGGRPVEHAPSTQMAEGFGCNNRIVVASRGTIRLRDTLRESLAVSYEIESVCLIANSFVLWYSSAGLKSEFQPLTLLH